MSEHWNGVPQNPEQERFHWVRTPDGENAPYLWRPAGECERGHWPAGWIYAANEWNPIDCTYLGPCLTPAEVAAAVQAERAAADDPQWDGTDAAHPAWWRGNDRGVAAAVQIVSDTLDGKPPGTYGSADLTALCQRISAVVEAARREEREACASLCDRDADLLRQDLNFDVARGVSHAAAAIRARSGGKEGA